MAATDLGRAPEPAEARADPLGAVAIGIPDGHGSRIPCARLGGAVKWWRSERALVRHRLLCSPGGVELVPTRVDPPGSPPWRSRPQRLVSTHAATRLGRFAPARNPEAMVCEHAPGRVRSRISRCAATESRSTLVGTTRRTPRRPPATSACRDHVVTLKMVATIHRPSIPRRDN